MDTEIEKIIEELKTFKNKYGDKRMLDNFEKQALEVKNPYLSLLFLSINGSNTEKHAQIIADSKNAECCFLSLKDGKIKDKNLIQLLANVIAETGDTKYNRLLIELSINKYSRRILDVKRNIYGDHYFEEVDYVVEIDTKDNEDAIIESDDLQAIYDTAIFLSSYHKEQGLKRDYLKEKYQQFEDKILESKNSKYCFLLAKNAPKSNKKKLSEIVLKSNNPYYSYKFALQVHKDNRENNIDYESLMQVLLNSDDYESMIDFISIYSYSVGRLHRGLDFLDKENYAEKLFKRIIEGKKANYIYKALKLFEEIQNRNHNMSYSKRLQIPSLSVSDFINAIIDSANPEYILLIIKEYPDVDYEKGLSSLISLGVNPNIIHYEYSEKIDSINQKILKLK